MKVGVRREVLVRASMGGNEVSRVPYGTGTLTDRLGGRECIQVADISAKREEGAAYSRPDYLVCSSLSAQCTVLG